ncbi:hypothetical protein QL285_050642 [Trifolium repens]|nr:hypothetical protein QL285_050642 [Trifolium repens]
MKTNHATSAATSSPPTTTTSLHHQQSSPKPDPGDAKSEHCHHHLNASPPPKTNKRKNRICSKTEKQQIRHQHTNSGDTKPEHQNGAGNTLQHISITISGGTETGAAPPSPEENDGGG